MNTLQSLLRILPRVPLPHQRILNVPHSSRICRVLNSTLVPNNLPKYRDGFNDITELESADPVIQKLFSLEMADWIETRKVLRTMNMEKYETKLEKNIANNTLHIRMLVEQLKQNHKDKQNKVFLIWAIDQRKKRLRRLQKLDIDKYNSLIEEYDIPPLESPHDPKNKYKFRKFKINVPLQKKRDIEDFEKDRNY